MKTSINEIGKEMADLSRLADEFEEADNQDNEWAEDFTFKNASDEALDRLDHLKQSLTFLRPETIDEILVLALMAAHHLKPIQPNSNQRHQRDNPQCDQYINARKVVPIMRLVDAIIAGIEKESQTTRQDLGLAFLRDQEDDRAGLVEKAADALLIQESTTESEKEAA